MPQPLGDPSLLGRDACFMPSLLPPPMQQHQGLRPLPHSAGGTLHPNSHGEGGGDMTRSPTCGLGETMPIPTRRKDTVRGWILTLQHSPQGASLGCCHQGSSHRQECKAKFELPCPEPLLKQQQRKSVYELVLKKHPKCIWRGNG